MLLLKKRIYLVLVVCCFGLFVFYPSRSTAASTTETGYLDPAKLKQYEQIITDRDQALRDIYSQLKEQDRLDHYEYYRQEIMRMTDEAIKWLKEGPNQARILSTSRVYAPNGGIAIEDNEYVTATYVHIPNKMIDSILADRASGILAESVTITVSFLKNKFVGSLEILISLMTGINTSILRMHRDAGNSVIQMSYIDHTEADRGSGGYVKWSTYPYISTGYDYVEAY